MHFHKDVEADTKGRQRVEIKVHLMETDISMMLGTPPPEKVMDRALMVRVWPSYTGKLQIKRHVSKHGNKANPDLHENPIPVDLNNSKMHESHRSSCHSREDACLLPYSDG